MTDENVWKKHALISAGIVGTIILIVWLSRRRKGGSYIQQPPSIGDQTVQIIGGQPYYDIGYEIVAGPQNLYALAGPIFNAHIGDAPAMDGEDVNLSLMDEYNTPQIRQYLTAPVSIEHLNHLILASDSYDAGEYMANIGGTEIGDINTVFNINSSFSGNVFNTLSHEYMPLFGFISQRNSYDALERPGLRRYRVFH